MSPIPFEVCIDTVESALAAEGRSLHDEPADALERRWRAAKHPLPDGPRGD